jgi:hypothetical protein
MSTIIYPQINQDIIDTFGVKNQRQLENYFKYGKFKISDPDKTLEEFSSRINNITFTEFKNKRRMRRLRRNKNNNKNSLIPVFHRYLEYKLILHSHAPNLWISAF